MLAVHWACLKLGETHLTLGIVALNLLQEAQAHLLPVSAFPPVNGECEQHTAGFISAPQAAGDQWPKGQVLTPAFATVFSRWGCASNVQQARS